MHGDFLKSDCITTCPQISDVCDLHLDVLYGIGKYYLTNILPFCCFWAFSMKNRNKTKLEQIAICFLDTHNEYLKPFSVGITSGIWKTRTLEESRNKNH